MSYIVQGHIMTSDCMLQLYNKSLNTLPALILEDVYITGILTENTEIKRIDSKLFVRLDWKGIDITSQLFDTSLSI